MSQVVAQPVVLHFLKVPRILIIEDEEDIREVAATALEIVAGWTVTRARSGREGIKTAQLGCPDAILLDVQMPEIDGPATLKLLQKEEALSTVPVLFLTARAQAAEQRRLIDIGAAAVLTKPFDPLTLAGDIAAVLGWASNQ